MTHPDVKLEANENLPIVYKISLTTSRVLVKVRLFRRTDPNWKTFLYSSRVVERSSSPHIQTGHIAPHLAWP